MLMAVMMSPRERWTDDRIDDLNEKVDRGFADLKTEMREGFERMEDRFGERFDDVDKRLVKLEDAYFTLNRTMWTGTCMIIAGLIGTGVFG